MVTETNTERLQRIKSVLPPLHDVNNNLIVQHEDWEWLIRRADLLEQAGEAARFSHNLQAERIGVLQSENARLQKEIQTMRHHILTVCNNVGAFPKATVKGYVHGVFADYLPKGEPK
ncbi:hypothetical protein NCCP2716_23290 [Sporosarcina sp. NCCP-2716]|uniref:hypothetical protein n=1 Tax=Sporosarcina sp. NCCP-2716 TaxID=2943679 RepID=UPI00203D8CB0|nr:hypothetical protein [Sporosarcina sp. NCCP-2716]GKV69831.1 hypothetical protein NCCP2716_23290 [Sporosarcina sp. NCCP-2716]